MPAVRFVVFFLLATLLAFGAFADPPEPDGVFQPSGVPSQIGEELIPTLEQLFPFLDDLSCDLDSLRHIPLSRMTRLGLSGQDLIDESTGLYSGGLSWYDGSYAGATLRLMDGDAVGAILVERPDADGSCAQGLEVPILAAFRTDDGSVELYWSGYVRLEQDGTLRVRVFVAREDFSDGLPFPETLLNRSTVDLAARIDGDSLDDGIVQAWVEAAGGGWQSLGLGGLSP